MKSIYLDHAAATPIDPAVLQAMQPYFGDYFYNPSALYSSAQRTARDLQQARSTVASVLGARPVEIIFTAGGTEANNLAIHGIMRQKWRATDMDNMSAAHIVTSAIEHDSVLEPAHQYHHIEVAPSPQGVIDPAAVTAAVTDQTVVISVMYANNEIGTVQPIRDITARVVEIRKDRRARGITRPLYVHADAAQAGNHLDIHVSRLGVDMLTLNGGKIYGPKQSGVLYVKSGIALEPLIRGGGQERGLRSGTENVAGAVGIATALQLAQTMRSDETHRLQQLQQHFTDSLQNMIPAVKLNGSIKKRLPNNVHITIPGADNERILFGLDEQGVMAAAGSACSASSDQPSHVLRAIGLSDAEARASLRFTMGRMTTHEDINHTVETLARLLQTA